MSASILTIVVLGPAAIVVAALFAMLWFEGKSAHDRRTALTTGAALALWAVLATVLARFPLALVPAFLVPLALSLHIISLWQLLAGTWAPPHRLADRSERR